MGKKLNSILKGQVAVSIFFIALGLCLVMMPVATVNVLCKVVFGLSLIGTGLYHVYVFVAEKEHTTILDLFSGVIVLVIGVFLFTNPQVVIKLLPLMLGAFLEVDSIWIIRGGLKLKKRGQKIWQVFLAEGIIFVALGAMLLAYPFQSVKIMILFAGWSFLCNGVLDVVLYIMLRTGLKREIVQDNTKVQSAPEPQPEGNVADAAANAAVKEPEAPKQAETPAEAEKPAQTEEPKEAEAQAEPEILQEPEKAEEPEEPEASDVPEEPVEVLEEWTD